jgi:hypothetical protein
MVSTSQAAPPWLDRSVTTASPTQAVNSTKTEGKDFHPFGEDGFSFLDLIDVVNPLHHIPVVGPLYRDITGDVIGLLPQIAGSTLFFGPIGAGLAAIDVVLKETTGRDTGDHILVMLRNPTTTQTTETAPTQTVGSDSSDPMDAWLQAEATYDEQFAAAQEPNAAAPKSTVATPSLTTTVADSVLAWAQAENAYRAGLATRQSASTAPTSPRPEQGGGVNVALGALARNDDHKAEAPSHSHLVTVN